MEIMNIKKEFGNPPKGADIRDKNGQVYVYYYEPNDKAKKWVDTIKKKYPKGIIFTKTNKMESKMSTIKRSRINEIIQEEYQKLIETNKTKVGVKSFYQQDNIGRAKYTVREKKHINESKDKVKQTLKLEFANIFYDVFGAQSSQLRKFYYNEFQKSLKTLSETERNKYREIRNELYKLKPNDVKKKLEKMLGYSAFNDPNDPMNESNAVNEATDIKIGDAKSYNSWMKIAKQVEKTGKPTKGKYSK